MKWRAMITHSRLTLTDNKIAQDPDYYDRFFKDLANPTDQEVQAFFSKYLEEPSDEWDIVINGVFTVVKDDAANIDPKIWHHPGD